MKVSGLKPKKSKGVIVLGILAVLVIMLIIATLVSVRQGKEIEYLVKQNLTEPNKFEIAFNSLLVTNDTRKNLIYSLSEVSKYDTHINKTLNRTFPERHIELSAQGKTFANDVPMKEKDVNVSLLRKIVLPFGESSKIKLTVWEK